MSNERHPNAMMPPDGGAHFAAALAGGVPVEAILQLRQERDHLLLLHEAVGDVERASSLDEKLHVFVEAIRRIGFGRVTITLRDADLNARHIVTAGLSPEDDALLRSSPIPGAVWARRFTQLERFRISNSYYLAGNDPWVQEEFGDGLPSLLEPGDDPAWSPRDTLLVPLRNASGGLVATLVLDEPADRARPSLTRVRTVELFGQQVASMLEHRSLMELAEHRARRLQHLHQVGSVLARSLDEPTILKSLARQVETILPVTSVVIFTPEETGAPWPRVLRRGKTDVDEMFTTAPVRNLAAVAGRAQRPAREGALLAVPAVLGPTTVAVIVVEGVDEHALTPSDADLLLTIASQAAGAVSNARLYAESLRQRRQTEALADVARAVGESLRIERVLQLILRHATALLRTDGATISLLRGDSLVVTAGVGVGSPLVGHRLPLHASISGRAVRTASSIIRDDVNEDPDAYAPSVIASQMRNTIIVPLLSVQGPVGALSVFNRAAPFTVDDAEVLQRLADQVAVAVVNARLFEEVAEATREWAVAFDSIGSGMVLLDKRGRIQRTNARALALMHVERDEDVAGKDFHGALFGDTDPCDACVHFAAMAESTVKRGTHDDHAHGRVFSITAAPHPHGGAVVTFDDVSEYRSLAERHQRVVETSRDAIVITDRDRRISFANPAARELLGRGQDIIGLPTSRAVPEDLRGSVNEYEERGLAGEPVSYESVVLRPDGDRRIVAISTAPLRELGEVTGIVASMRDITDERRARDAVAQSEARYRNLFQSASDAIYTMDVRGAFTSANQATCTLTGRTHDNLLAQTVGPMIADEDVPDVKRNFKAALAGSAVGYECHLLRPDGQRRTISVTNSPIRRGDAIVGVLGIARDITDERARASALARSESRYSRLVESATDAIFTVDEQGRFTAVNRALEQAVGREREALLGTTFAEFVDPRDLLAARRLLRETYDGDRSRGAVRFAGRHGDVRNGSVIMSPVVEGDIIVGALGILRDVTDEQRLSEQLLQQEKLVAVGQLVSGVAHELNNPLAAVMAFAQLLLVAPAPLAEEPRQMVDTIHREAKRAAKIVNSLLTFARQQPAERSAAQLNDLVNDTLELRRYAMRMAKIEVKLELDENLPETWADPYQIQQVVVNLITNAEQALAEHPQPRRLTIRTALEGTRLLLVVADNGPGIPRDQLDRIFNPFFTTKPVGQGTGLGLSISDGIVREHGGRIRVESTVGAGAAFIMEIPYLPPPDDVEVERTLSTDERNALRHILVVDDEPSMRSAVSGFLRAQGHAVDVGRNGVEARALLARNDYDVVLLDLRMPELGGEALYRELQQTDPAHARRVVFVTGDLQSEDAQHFLNEAGRPVIGKPFQLDDLNAVLASLAG